MCLSVPCRIPTLLHGLRCNLGNGIGRGCPLVVHYLADLQLVHGFHCYDNIAPNTKCQLACLNSPHAWLKEVFPQLLLTSGLTTVCCSLQQCCRFDVTCEVRQGGMLPHFLFSKSLDSLVMVFMLGTCLLVMVTLSNMDLWKTKKI